MKLQKYINSTFNNEKITDIELIKGVDDLAWVKLFNNEKELKMIPLWLFYEDAIQYSADYILCDIQEERELEINK